MFKARHVELRARIEALLSSGPPMTYTEVCIRLGRKKPDAQVRGIHNHLARHGMIEVTGERRRLDCDFRALAVYRWVAANTSNQVPAPRPARNVAPPAYIRGYRWGSSVW